MVYGCHLQDSPLWCFQILNIMYDVYDLVEWKKWWKSQKPDKPWTHSNQTETKILKTYKNIQTKQWFINVLSSCSDRL